MTDESTSSPPLHLWVQILLGAAAGGVVGAVIASLALIGVPFNVLTWIVIFALVWLAVYLCMRFHLRGLILGFGIATFLGYVIVQTLLNYLSRP